LKLTADLSITIMVARFLPRVVHRSVQLLDRCLSVLTVPRPKLQLLASVSFMIESQRVPGKQMDIENAVYVSASQYNGFQVCASLLPMQNPPAMQHVCVGHRRHNTRGCGVSGRGAYFFYFFGCMLVWCGWVGGRRQVASMFNLVIGNTQHPLEEQSGETVYEFLERYLTLMGRNNLAEARALPLGATDEGEGQQPRLALALP
jgi:hypothetical protein